METERRKRLSFDNIISLFAIFGTIAIATIGFIFQIKSMWNAQAGQEVRLCKVEGKAEQIPLMQRDIDYIKQTVDRIDRKLSR